MIGSAFNCHVISSHLTGIVYVNNVVLFAELIYLVIKFETIKERLEDISQLIFLRIKNAAW
jgi:hypothetical protein